MAVVVFSWDAILSGDVMRERELDSEGAALAEFAFDPDGAAMQLYDLQHAGQADPVATDVTLDLLRAPVWVEALGLIRLGDAHPPIVDLDHAPCLIVTLLAADLDHDFAPVRTVLDRV